LQRFTGPYFSQWCSSVCVIDHWINNFISALQVDLHGLLSMVPLPLSQGVVLSLLQQLACDINNDMSRKISWMTDVSTAINPSDPMITMHVRPIFEQVYQILNHQRNLPSISGSDLSSIRLLLHVINSMLTTCKWFISWNVQICHLNTSNTIGILYKAVSFIERVKIGKVYSVKYSPPHCSFLSQVRLCFSFKFSMDEEEEVLFLSNNVCNYW
jgi:hypothetical protein